MATGFRGTFVISWTQTEVDGVLNAEVGALSVGSTWRRYGEPTRLDGPVDLLLLDDAEGEADLRRRAARSVHRLVGQALHPAQAAYDNAEPLLDRGFVLTDGRVCFTATEIATGGGRPPLLMFLNEMPPENTDLWVVRTIAEAPTPRQSRQVQKGVICFVHGTRIATPAGPKLVEELREDDLVLTKDNGPQPVMWTGWRRMSGARLFAMPHLRPIRVHAGALGAGRPDGDLLVSPLHRLLVRGRHAEALFQTPEVLVAAKDLINDRSILTDHQMKEVTYVHLLLEAHQVLFANGVEAESFHPANTSLDVIAEDQRDRLLDLVPVAAQDPFAYGDFARRNLSAYEAAVLQHEGGIRH